MYEYHNASYLDSSDVRTSETQTYSLELDYDSDSNRRRLKIYFIVASTKRSRSNIQKHDLDLLSSLDSDSQKHDSVIYCTSYHKYRQKKLNENKP